MVLSPLARGRTVYEGEVVRSRLISLRRLGVVLPIMLLVALIAASSAFAASVKYEAESTPNPPLAYTGTWTTSSLPGHSGGAVEFTTDGGTPASATLTFTGTGIDYYAAKWYNRGIAAVSIDGGPEELVDLYAPGVVGDTSTVSYQQLVFSKRDLPLGTHTIRVRFTGTFNPAASSPYLITIDYFEAFDDPPVVTTSASSTWSILVGVLMAGALAVVVARRRAA